MDKLSKLFIFKITATVLLWCAPLILAPTSWLDAAGLPVSESAMFIRMLGWAYLALCVGYTFGLRASLRGQRAPGPIWMGIVSNGGACIYLCYYGWSGAWVSWAPPIQLVGWVSATGTFLITVGLIVFGVRRPTRAVLPTSPQHRSPQPPP